MRILEKPLRRLVPALAKSSLEKLGQELFMLGFEADLLEGKEPVIDVSITPNRGDAMSTFGIARELSAKRQVNLKSKPKVLEIGTVSKKYEKLPEGQLPRVNFNDGVCDQYHGVIFESVKVAESPDWLKKEIVKLGLRPTNNVVDLTNYLMELYGQPLHAFDLDAILDDEMTVRAAKDGETVTTLDGTEHKLVAGVPVINDRKAIIDLAGIMGGANSAVDARTSRIFLQSAIFDRQKIYLASKRLKFRTDASVRYERGVDPKLSEIVLSEAVNLLSRQEFGRAKPISKLSARTKDLNPITIDFKPERAAKLIGEKTEPDQAKRILELIGCSVSKRKNGWAITPPSWRFDLVIWQDLAEEIARLVGLDENITSQKLSKSPSSQERSEFEWAEAIKDRLVELGFNEVQTYSFISKNDLTRFELPNVGELANALNPKVKYLRSSLLPGLTRVIAANSVFDPILIFEIGHVFAAKKEVTTLGLGVAGSTPEAKSWLSRFADSIGLNSEEVIAKSTLIELDQRLKDEYKIRKNKVTLVELPLEFLADGRRIPANFRTPAGVATYRPLSKHPPARRDIAILVDRGLDTEEIEQLIRETNQAVESIQLFDEFISEKLGLNRKSLAYHILYSSPDRTLTDQEVDLIHAEIESALKKSFGAEIR